MAKLTWTIDSAAGVVAHDGPNISDVNMDRFIDFLWTNYPQLDGNGDPLPRNNANEAQAFRDWADIQWEGTKANVIRWEKTAAAQAAEAGVPDIT